VRIRCISNRGADIPDDGREPRAGISSDTLFPLTVGKEYVVYGWTVWRAYPWYYIADDNHSYYPVWHPAPLFEVVDGRLSRYWVYSYHRAVSRYDRDAPVVAFREWAEDPYFYDRLTDGDAEAIATFRRYQELTDREAEGGDLAARTEPDALREQLAQALALLAAPAEAQLAHLADIGGPDAVDELALELDDALPAIRAQWTSMPTELARILDALDAYLADMSKTPDLWTAEAVRTASAWTIVRHLAAAATGVLSQ
jgi:hypothetical protein